MSNRDFHESNRQSWNEATKQHNSHKGDQIAFFNNNGDTLFPEEKELLGDIWGKTLLHLQCNAGQDTLSIAKHMGALVTGVDISDEAINFANQLSVGAKIPAKFIRNDIYEWFANNTSQYEVVFSSYGAINWLSDLKAWAEGIANALKIGGKFVLMEFHPFTRSLDTDWTLKYDYFGGSMLTTDGIGDYVGESDDGLIFTENKPKKTQPFVNPHPAHEFSWGIADIITALMEAGLTLNTFQEYPYSNGWKPFQNMRELPNRRMAQPEGMPQVPMMFGLVMQKQTGTKISTGTTSIDAIIETLTDEFAPPADSAQAQELCLQHGASAIPHLIEALRANMRSVPHGITDTLFTFGTQAVEGLIELLEDEHWLNRFTAVNLLGRIGDDRIIEPLMGCLKDNNSRVTLSAIYWLGTLGDRRAEELLRTVIQKSDGKIREQAIDALRKLDK